jgi:hypothetical protein
MVARREKLSPVRKGSPEPVVCSWTTLDGLLYIRPGQTFADQELLLISTESRGPPHILIGVLVYGKPQEIYNNTGCSKSHATHGEMQYKFYFLLLCLFLIINVENVHHYALHRGAHDESC